MKRFKEYVKDVQPPKVAFNAHGTHAKHDLDSSRMQSKSPKVAFNAHGTHAKHNSYVVEITESDKPDFWNSNENEHLGDDNDSIMDKLHKLHPLDEHSQSHLHTYSSGSSGLNAALIRAHNTNTLPPKSIRGHNVEGLDSSFTPSKTTLHTYSGIGFNPSKLDMIGKSESGNPVFKSPTYLSTSHNKGTASSFAEDNKPYHGENAYHILHIRTEPGQRIGVIGDHSKYPHEQETTMPRDEHYEYIGSTTHMGNSTTPYIVHHVRRISPSQVIKK